MKSRQTLAFHELQTLVASQLSRLFTPDVKMLKTRVEDLVNRQYLKRQNSDPNTLVYLA
jgi:hypothetical protein